MLRVDAAVIGGTGVGSFLADRGGRCVVVPTEFGCLRGRLSAHRGKSVLAVERHARGHRTPPHAVNYRAIAAGLRALGVKACVSSAAVGSLREDWGPGTFAVCTDLLDATGRRLTLFDRDVRHTDMGTAFPLSAQVFARCQEAKLDAREQAVYVGCDGPRYETPAEIRALRTLGGEVVGMTASSEAVLLREAGVPYGCLAVVTNMGCGLTPATLEHGDVARTMEKLGGTVAEILLDAAVEACG